MLKPRSVQYNHFNISSHLLQQSPICQLNGAADENHPSKRNEQALCPFFFKVFTQGGSWSQRVHGQM